MAFSTQKDFFHVPFLNESVDYECRPACSKLKSYESTTDDRSWALDETLQSRFLSDLVTCQTPVRSGDSNRGDGDNYDDSSAGASTEGTTARRKYPDSARSGAANLMDAAGTSGGGKTGRGGGAGGLIAADSLLVSATERMGRIEELLTQNEGLQKKLEVSNERLKVLNMENETIKTIMNEKFDSNHAKDFRNKVQKLATGGKITKAEENDLLQIYSKFEDMSKAYEILKAENSQLKRLVEKLSQRATYQPIKMEPERSRDINYLQKEVDKLRQEVGMWRKSENEKLEAKTAERSKMSDEDVENIKAIIRERNALREKCKTLNDLESKLKDLQRMAKEADKMSGNLTSDLESRARYICKMEQDMEEMQEYYEAEISKLKYNEELLKCQMDEMKEQLIRAKCDAQKAEGLQIENGCLRNELMRRDMELNDYDFQYKQLIYKTQKYKQNGYCMCNRNPDADHDTDNCLSDS